MSVADLSALAPLQEGYFAFMESHMGKEPNVLLVSKERSDVLWRFVMANSHRDEEFVLGIKKLPVHVLRFMNAEVRESDEMKEEEFRYEQR